MARKINYIITCNVFAGKEGKLIVGRTGANPQSQLRILEKIFIRLLARNVRIQKTCYAPDK
jgi:hypothetical protein